MRSGSAPTRARLARLFLFALAPILLLSFASSYALWRGALERAMLDLGQQRDRVIAVNLAARDTAEGLLRGLAAAIAANPDACAELLARATTTDLRVVVRGGACPGASTASPGDGLALRVAVPIPGRANDALLVSELSPRGGDADAKRWLFDADGQMVGFGSAAPPAGVPSMALGESVSVLTTADGTALLVATGQLGPGLGVAYAVPAGPVRAAALRLALLHLAEVAALLAIGAAGSMFAISRVVTRPLNRLRDAVVRWRAGVAPLELPDEPAAPRELRQLADAIRDGAETLAQREAELRTARDQAELLAGEVHHRVKNNLQTVSSLLALQAHRVADPSARAEFEAARDRVGALATLHRHLYAQHDPEAIDLSAFISELGAQLFAAVGERPGRRIALEVEAPSLRIPTDQAVPLALAITEAVADALRQGFGDGRSGRIAIRVNAEGERARLVVEDDGMLPRPEDPLRAMLLRGLGRQLGGELKVEGGRVTLDFKLRPPAARQPVSLRPQTQPGPPPQAPSSPA